MSVEAAAAEANLTYVSDQEPGITRRRCGSGFAYRRPDGSPVRDEATLERIRTLAIPPAWSGVWIGPDPSGHIQATGRDAKGRKQYVYHPGWHEQRGGTKYEKLVELARLLPALRARVEADLKRPAPSKPRVLATVVRLLETTLIRIGNPEYAKANESYGLTTLKDEHVEVQGTSMRFEFRGKSGKTWRLSIADRRIANAVRACQELPGQHLFQYVEAGERYPITSGDINAYLREATAAEVSAKDIRTWAGTVLMAVALAQADPPTGAGHARKVVSAAVKRVAQQLGNTPTVCRKSYVHPRVLEAYESGALGPAFAGKSRSAPPGLTRHEHVVLDLLTTDPAPAQVPDGAPVRSLSADKDERGRRRGARSAAPPSGPSVTAMARDGRRGRTPSPRP